MTITIGINDDSGVDSDSILVHVVSGSPLSAEVSAAWGAGVEVNPSVDLVSADLEKIIEAAKSAWANAASQAGHTLQALDNVDVRVADLVGDGLGLAVSEVIWIDHSKIEFG